MRRTGLAVLLSALALSQTPAAAAGTPAGTVRLTVAPGASLVVPMGWISCDAAVRARLNSVPDTLHVRGGMCPAPEAHDPRFRVYHSEGVSGTTASVVSAVVTYVPEASFGDQLAALKPSDMPEVQRNACASQTAPMVAHGLAIASCTVEIAHVKGRLALVSHLVATDTVIKSDPVDSRIIEMDYGKGHIQLQLKVSPAGNARLAAQADALVESLDVE